MQALQLTRTLIALTASATTLACASAADASGVTVYGGTVEDGGPLALELTQATDLLAPLGRLTLSTVAVCPDEQPSLILSVDQAVVSPFNIPAGDVLLGSRRPGGRLLASGVRSLQFGDDVGLVHENITVRARNGRASGSYRATVEFRGDGGGTCSTGVIRWRARSRPGRIYAGATSEDQAVVLTLDRSGRRVQQLRIGSVLSCGIADLRGLNTFSATLQSDGRFADSDRYSDDELGRGRDRIRGRVSGTRASGTFRDTRTTAGANGEDVRCESGHITWRARTSRRTKKEVQSSRSPAPRRTAAYDE